MIDPEKCRASGRSGVNTFAMIQPGTRLKAFVSNIKCRALFRRSVESLVLLAFSDLCRKCLATLSLLTAGALLAGCTTPDVSYADLDPPASATITDHSVTVHLGLDFANSACFTRPKARVEGRVVLITGHRTLRDQNRDFLVTLPSSVDSKSVELFWVNPDGRQVPIPTEK